MNGIGLVDTVPVASSGWSDIFKNLTSIFGQTGANILNSKYATVPIYSTTNSPYGSSQTVYQTPGQGSPSGGVISTPLGSGIGSSNMLLIGGAVLIVVLMSKK